MSLFTLHLLGGVLLLGSLTLACSLLYSALSNGIGPMPTSRRVRRALLELVPPLPAGATIYELGAGWGHLLVALAKHYPHCRIIGYENSLVPYLWCRSWLWASGMQNAQVIYGDFWKADLSSASLICCYLYRGAMCYLSDKLTKELAMSCYVCTHTFAMPHWQPLRQRRADDLYRTMVYLYRKDMDSNDG